MKKRLLNLNHADLQWLWQPCDTDNAGYLKSNLPTYWPLQRLPPPWLTQIAATATML
jgi:hypothetical protein